MDAVSQSFVESGDDIPAVRRAAAEIGYRPFIIAKIERARAFDRIDDILDAADGIMVARGDLGVEIPIERSRSSKSRWSARRTCAGSRSSRPPRCWSP